MRSAQPRVAVFGPGLMGASLLMAMRKSSPHTELRVWARRPEAARETLRRGLADSASDDAASVVREADTVVLCVPVDRMEEVAEAIAPHIGENTLVTDVGSTKEALVARMEKIFSVGRNFVGSHPMCGSEESGMDAARADLYAGALCVVCPTAATRDEMTNRAEELWRLVGGRTAKLSPAEHDAAAALASHAPHVAAAALVEIVAQGPEGSGALCASGFRDTTRIASGSPELWSAILAENADRTAEALEALEKVLAGYRKAILARDRAEIAKRLESAAAYREKLFPNG